MGLIQLKDIRAKPEVILKRSYCSFFEIVSTWYRVCIMNHPDYISWIMPFLCLKYLWFKDPVGSRYWIYSRVWSHPRPCAWGLTSTVSRVTPLPTLCTWGHKTTVSRVTSSQPCPRVHMPASPGWPPPDPVPGIPYPQSVGWHPSQTLNLGSCVLELQGEAPS